MGRWIMALLVGVCLTGRLAHGARLKPGAVIYGVVPPLFGHLPLRSVIARLDELRDLGIDILWLSPLFTTDDPGQISYAVTDYANVRADFGSNEDLAELVREAHRRGLRVLLDMVPNHISINHPYVLETQRLGRASSYYEYLQRDESGGLVNYFDWFHLPNLNFDFPPVVGWIQNVFTDWMNRARVDGFRVDAAWGPHQRKPKFWEDTIRKARRSAPDSVWLAEASARDTSYYTEGFDLAYDWTDELGRWAWADAFAQPERAGAVLAEQLRLNARPQSVVRFLNNNDTGKRFITRHGPRLTRVALALQYTVPGVPIVFTGDETGAAYEPYEDNAPLPRFDPYGLRDDYRHWAEWRETIPALHSGDFHVLAHDAPDSALAFTRAHGNSRLLAVFNFGARATDVHVALPGFPSTVSLRGHAALIQTLDGLTIRVGDDGAVASAIGGDHERRWRKYIVRLERQLTRIGRNL